MKLIIVVPCYNEEEVLHETTLRLTNIISSMIDHNLITVGKILYVNDGSKDRTWDIIEEYHKANPSLVMGIKLAKNAGHQSALLAGLNWAINHCDAAISIDADLQDDINIIPEMIKKYHERYDIVYGVRNSRETDTFFKRSTALGFYKLMNILGVKIVYNHADFRLLSQRALMELSKYHEKNLFLRGIVSLIGYKSTNVYYNRLERFAGESKYPFSKMLNFAIQGITSFSIKPLRITIILGVIFILMSLYVLTHTLVSLFLNKTVQGWTSIMISMWFIGGLLLISLGIIGEYIGKIYIEVKNRPLYNIEQILSNDTTNENNLGNPQLS